MRRFWGVLGVLVALLGAGDEVRGQTRADSAAVLLNAAEALRVRGETGAARAVLELIERSYAGTPAALQVEAMRALLRRVPDVERSGRTELVVFGTMFGAATAMALPYVFADTDEAAIYGLALLVGGPAGLVVAKNASDRKLYTEGQSRAITFGGTWGIYQGLALLEVFDINETVIRECAFPPCYDYETGPGQRAQVTAALLGGLVGIGTGAWLAEKPITAGTATAVSLGGMWGTWFGFGAGYLAGMEGDALLGATMLGGNAALIGAGMLAPQWQMSRSRARLISLGGLVGGLGGVGLLLILQPNDDRSIVSVPLLTSALGLAVAASRTRTMEGPPLSEPDGGNAFLNIREGRWSFGTPLAQIRLARTESGLRPGAYVPLLRARF